MQKILPGNAEGLEREIKQLLEKLSEAQGELERVRQLEEEQEKYRQAFAINALADRQSVTMKDFESLTVSHVFEACAALGNVSVSLSPKFMGVGNMSLMGFVKSYKLMQESVTSDR